MPSTRWCSWCAHCFRWSTTCCGSQQESQRRQTLRRTLSWCPAAMASCGVLILRHKACSLALFVMSAVLSDYSAYHSTTDDAYFIHELGTGELVNNEGISAKLAANSDKIGAAAMTPAANGGLKPSSCSLQRNGVAMSWCSDIAAASCQARHRPGCSCHQPAMCQPACCLGSQG